MWSHGQIQNKDDKKEQLTKITVFKNVFPAVSLDNNIIVAHSICTGVD